MDKNPPERNRARVPTLPPRRVDRVGAEISLPPERKRKNGLAAAGGGGGLLLN